MESMHVCERAYQTINKQLVAFLILKFNSVVVIKSIGIHCDAKGEIKKNSSNICECESSVHDMCRTDSKTVVGGGAYSGAMRSILLFVQLTFDTIWYTVFNCIYLTEIDVSTS